MKWETAVKKIEKALAEDKIITVIYHRKWNNSHCYLDVVDKIISYEWEGATVQAISTYHNVVDPYSYIIDEVNEKEGD